MDAALIRSDTNPYSHGPKMDQSKSPSPSCTSSMEKVCCFVFSSCLCVKSYGCCDNRPRSLDVQIKRGPRGEIPQGFELKRTIYTKYKDNDYAVTCFPCALCSCIFSTQVNGFCCSMGAGPNFDTTFAAARLCVWCPSTYTWKPSTSLDNPNYHLEWCPQFPAS